MNVDKKQDDIQVMVTELSDENKKYVIAVAQALLFTQMDKKGQKGGRRSDKYCKR